MFDPFFFVTGSTLITIFQCLRQGLHLLGFIKLRLYWRAFLYDVFIVASLRLTKCLGSCVGRKVSGVERVGLQLSGILILENDLLIFNFSFFQYRFSSLEDKCSKVGTGTIFFITWTLGRTIRPVDRSERFMLDEGKDSLCTRG